MQVKPGSFVIVVDRVRRHVGQEAAERGLSGERAQTIPFNGSLNGVISASGHPLKNNHTSRPYFGKKVSKESTITVTLFGNGFV